MKNLCILTTQTKELFSSINAINEGSNINAAIICHCNIIEQYSIYVCVQLNDLLILAIYNHSIKQWIQIPINLPEHDHAFDLSGFHAKASLLNQSDHPVSIYIAMRTGHLYTIPISSSSIISKTLNAIPIAVVDGGIDVLNWSPDSETAVLITLSIPQSLILLTGNMEPIQESIILDPTCNPSQTLVNVGWGKVETQFSGQGYREKQKYDKDTYNVDYNDTRESIVSWRADGIKFSVSIFDSKSNTRKIRIYQRDGKYICPTEDLTTDKLSPCFCWRPSGELLTCASYSHSNTNIIFFEPNGLRHGEFSLEKSIIKHITWNSDSTILAINCIKESKNVIQLWTTSNYHYYLKCEFDTLPILAITWHQNHPGWLYFITSSGSFHSIHVDWIITRSNNHSSIVGVVDGNQLLLTPFLYRTIPPPMYSTKILLPDHVVIRDTFFRDDNNNTMIYILTSSILFVYIWEDIKSDAKLLTSTTLPDGFIAKQFFSNNESSTKIGILGTTLLVLEDTLEVSHSISFDDCIRATWYNSNDVLIQDMNGTLYIVNIEYSTHIQQFHISLPYPAHDIYLIKDDNCTIISKSNNIDGNSSLSVNDRVLYNGVSSFLVTNQFIIFTLLSKEQKIICIPLSDLDNHVIADNMKRFLERGGIIIHSVQSHSSLILQMPRGNLEQVYPRPLVIYNILEMLKKRQFYQAFMLCRQQRMDLNLLVDTHESSFYSSIDEFITQVNQVEYLNLFLSQLKEDGKINKMCKLIRESIDRKGWTTSHFETILTSLLVQKPPEYPSAMRLLNSAFKDKKVYNSSIKYALFLISGDRLYQEALSECHLNLALDIAQHCQKDPQEYLPFLQKLQQLSLSRQKYLANDSLKRFRLALQGLSNEGKIDECIEYVVMRGIYKEALEIFTDDELICSICLKYAEFLSKNNDLFKSGNLYSLASRLSDNDLMMQAISAYCKNGNWIQIQCLVSIMKEKSLISNRDIDYIGMMIKDSLISKKEYSLASKACLELCNDVDNAIESLLLGDGCNNSMNIMESIHLCWNRKRLDLLETSIVPSWEKKLKVLQKEIDINLDKWNQLMDRLNGIRKKIIVKIDETIDIDEANDCDTLASTVQSSISKQSFGSKASRSTRRRKEKSGISSIKALERRRKAAEKSGSPYEEWYILDTIATLLLQFNQHKNMFNHICSSWIFLDGLKHFSEIRNLIILFKQMCDIVNQSKSVLLQYPKVPDLSPSTLLLCGVHSIEDFMKDIYSAYFKVKFILDDSNINDNTHLDWISLLC